MVGLICCDNVALFVVSSSYFLWHVTEIGLGLIGFGVMFTLLGVFLFFERSFVAIGNVRFSLLTIWPLFCCSSSNALCLCPLICLYFVSSLMELFVRSDPPSVWGDLNHWTDVYLANFHETTKFEGSKFTDPLCYVLLHLCLCYYLFFPLQSPFSYAKALIIW